MIIEICCLPPFEKKTALLTVERSNFKLARRQLNVSQSDGFMEMKR